MSMFVSTRQHTMVLQGVGLAWPLRYFVPWTNWLKFCWRRWELWTSPRQSLLLECEQGCRALSLRLGNKQRFFDGRWVLWCTMVCWNVWSDLFPLILIFSLPTPIMPHLPPLPPFLPGTQVVLIYWHMHTYRPFWPRPFQAVNWHMLCHNSRTLCSSPKRTKHP